MEKLVCTIGCAMYVALVTLFMGALLAGSAVWLIVLLFGAPTFHPAEIRG